MFFEQKAKTHSFGFQVFCLIWSIIIAELTSESTSPEGSFDRALSPKNQNVQSIQMHIT